MQPTTSVRSRFDRSDSPAGTRQPGPVADLDLTSEELSLLRTWRIERGLRQPAPRVEQITIGDVLIDRAAHTVSRAGRDVGLSPKEYDLLLALALRVDTAVPREVLMAEVWNYQNRVSSRTLDQHVAQLRKKIEDDARDPNY
ncbi:MAG: winged helix-turn-helix domain-containing protein, partial [Thermoanaerobaculia bacterium]